MLATQNPPLLPRAPGTKPDSSKYTVKMAGRSCCQPLQSHQPLPDLFPPHRPSLSQAHQAHACLCSLSFAVCSSRTFCPRRFCLVRFFTLKSPSSLLLTIIWPLSLKRPHHPLPVHAHILSCFIFLIASVIIWDYISESFLCHLSLPEKKYNLSDAENMLIAFPVSGCMYIMSINKQTNTKQMLQEVTSNSLCSLTVVLECLLVLKLRQKTKRKLCLLSTECLSSKSLLPLWVLDMRMSSTSRGNTGPWYSLFIFHDNFLKLFSYLVTGISQPHLPYYTVEWSLQLFCLDYGEISKYNFGQSALCPSSTKMLRWCLLLLSHRSKFPQTGSTHLPKYILSLLVTLM